MCYNQQAKDMLLQKVAANEAHAVLMLQRHVQLGAKLDACSRVRDGLMWKGKPMSCRAAGADINAVLTVASQR